MKFRPAIALPVGQASSVSLTIGRTAPTHCLLQHSTVWMCEMANTVKVCGYPPDATPPGMSWGTPGIDVTLSGLASNRHAGGIVPDGRSPRMVAA
jgi:hypothetical protein